MTQPDTKQRILAIAGELFARQGYTGTTIADIARELGTTTAALYYHFPSKAAILGGLLARPLAAYTRLLDGLDSGGSTPERPARRDHRHHRRVPRPGPTSTATRPRSR